MKPTAAILRHVNVVKAKRIYHRAGLLIPRHATYPRIAKAYVFLLCLMVSTQATSIVVLRTPTEVVLGADSRGTFFDGKTVEYKTVCKIYERGGVFFAVAGMAHDPL